MRLWRTCWRRSCAGRPGVALAAERAFLTALDGSCRTPIGGYATLDNGRVTLRGTVLRPDGSQAFDEEMYGDEADAAAIGTDRRRGDQGPPCRRGFSESRACPARRRRSPSFSRLREKVAPQSGVG